MLLAQAETKTYFIDLSAYPEWLVVLVGTLLAVLAIWVVMKLLKWTLWLLLFAVLIGGVLWAMYLLVGPATAPVPRPKAAVSSSGSL